MTQDEKNILLARAVGWDLEWRRIKGKNVRRAVKKDKGIIYTRETFPDYFNDLNEAHKLEELVWIDRYRYDYNRNLDLVIGATPLKGPESKTGPWIYEGTKARRATAAHRAEAIGLTLELWK